MESKANAAGADAAENFKLRTMLDEREAKMKNAEDELKDAKRKEDEMHERIAKEKAAAEALQTEIQAKADLQQEL
jgi:chromosome segregation ATPase